MNDVRVWAGAVCCAVLAASLLSYFSPGGSMERAFRLVLSAFAVLSLISPVSGLLESDFSSELRAFRDGTAQAELTAFVDGQVIDALETNLKGVVAASLAEMDLIYKNVAVKTDTAEDGRIVINRIVVTLPQEEAAMCASAAESLERALGIPTEVITDGAGA